MSAILLLLHVQDPTGRPIEGALIEGDSETFGHWQGLTNKCGDFAPTLAPDHYTLKISAAGWGTRVMPADFASSGGPINIGLDPPVPGPGPSPDEWTPEKLCAVRGAMWTARLDIPYGPRPDRPDNINALDYAESFDPPTRRRMYTNFRAEHYTHCVDGPMVDEGYHGQYPATDFRGNPDAYFDVMAEKWGAGICPVHFAYPDSYGFDAGSFDQFVRDFEPIYRSARAQQLVRLIVPYGWERGYEVTSAMWVRMFEWTRSVLPAALIAVHLRADQDAPTGGHDDQIPGWTNAKAWAAVAPFVNLWLVQNGGYVNEGQPRPSPTFLRNFTDQFRPEVRGSLADRFVNGYAGWPTSSANGVNKPIGLIAGEFASYVDYWQNFPEIEAQRLGDAAIEAGALGSLDGCYAP